MEEIYEGNLWRKSTEDGGSRWKSVEVYHICGTVWELLIEVGGCAGTKWKQTKVDGSRWDYLNANRSFRKLWKLVEVDGSLWKYMEARGSRWESVESCIEATGS